MYDRTTMADSTNVRRMHALLLLYGECVREQDQTIESLRSGDETFRVITLTDSATQIENVRVARIWDRGFPGFIISIPSMRLTFYFGYGRGLPSHIMTMSDLSLAGTLTSDKHEELWNYAVNIITDYANIHEHMPGGGTVLAFCMFCIWYHTQGLSMAKFPRVVDVQGIRECGAFSYREK